MKRVAVIAIFMAIMASLFAFPVLAAGPTTFNDYSATASNNGVQITLRAVQFKSSSLGTSILPGGMESVFYTTCEIKNTNTDAAILNPILFNITLSVDKTISHIYSYSSDLLIQKETYFKIIPSSEFSYDGMIVVPPESTLYFVGEICTTANLDQTGQTVDDAGLRGIDFVGTGSSYIVGHGDYPYGNPVDFSPVINLMNSEIATLENVEDMVDYIVSPSTHSFTYTAKSGNNAYKLKDILYENNIRVRSQVIQSINIITDDIEVIDYLENGTVNDHIVADVVYDEYLTFANNNSNSWAMSYYVYNMSVSPTVPTGWTFLGKHYELMDSNVDYAYTYTASTDLHRISIKQRIGSTNKFWMYPLGYQYIHIRYHRLYVWNSNDQNVSVNFNFGITDNSGVADGHNLTTSRSEAYDNYIQNNDQNINLIRIYLKNLLDSYNSVNNIDDIDDTAAEVTNKSESAHTQEQSYFTQNAQAIEQTGLSNYRFNGDQENGIGSVSHDFTLLWNALGGFNSVYVFSLTLSLALMVLRHAPGVIRSSRRNKEE